jgi:hypothetical protein
MVPTRADADAQLSLVRLYLLRGGYLFFAVGLVVTKWPLLIGHDLTWPLFEGVVCQGPTSVPGQAYCR